VIRNSYSKIGVSDYYKLNGNTYINPHMSYLEEASKWIKDNFNFDYNDSLDLFCGSGEMTKLFNCKEGCDPYTHDNYIRNTNKNCLKLSFDDISKGELKNTYNTIICSYALHLANESILPLISYNLSLVTKNLIILSPNKRPKLDYGFFELIANNKIKKVNSYVYESKLS